MFLCNLRIIEISKFYASFLNANNIIPILQSHKMITNNFMMIDYPFAVTSMTMLFCVQKLGHMKSKRQGYRILGCWYQT